MVSFAVLPDGYTREGLLFRDTTVRGGTTLDLAALPGERVLVRALPVTECGLDYDRSLDLSAFVRDGRLRWLAPEGRWTVAEINRSALYEAIRPGPTGAEDTPRAIRVCCSRT